MLVVHFAAVCVFYLVNCYIAVGEWMYHKSVFVRTDIVDAHFCAGPR